MLYEKDDIEQNCEAKFLECINHIVESINPEIVICFASRQNTTSSWSAFFEQKKELRAEYDLLIVTNDNTRYNDRHLLEKIEKFNTETFTLFSVIHRATPVAIAINQRHPFFVSVLSNGKVLYDKAGFKKGLAMSQVKPNPLTQTGHWNHYYTLSEQFLAGAEFYKSMGNRTLAAFMLHQVVEHACIALIFRHLGYRATTHNLNHLLGLTKCISLTLCESLQRATSTGPELFKLLEKAYGDARYKQDFTVSLNHLEILYDRVLSFVKETKNISAID